MCRSTGCCFLYLQATLLPSDHQQMGLPQKRAHGTTITLWGSKVLKEVDLRQNAMLAVIHQRMSNVYAVQSRYLVEAQQGYPKIKGTTYTVYLKPVGRGMDPKNLRLYDLQTAVK